MPDPNIPDCFCNKESLMSCDWKLEVTSRLYRPGDPGATDHTTGWTIENIPQPLGQLISQLFTESLNHEGWRVYTEWVSQCFADDPEMLEMIIEAGKKLGLAD